jgi:hypothetical protein
MEEMRTHNEHLAGSERENVEKIESLVNENASLRAECEGLRNENTNNEMQSR